MSDKSGVEQRLKAGVEFSEEAVHGEFRGLSLAPFDFTGSVVADLTPNGPQLTRWLISQGARHAYACSTAPAFEAENRIECWGGDVWDFPFGSIDFAFVDPRRFAEFDDVSDAARLVERISGMLSATGSCFIVLRSGTVQMDWDVFNSTVLTPIGRLPSSPYLYGTLLGDYAVRPLFRIRDDASTYHATRIFRISRRKPTLLLVVGRSQSGKTTLARSFVESRPGTHVSSDYVYFNLFQVRKHLSGPLGAERLGGVLGEATAEDTGRFFRSLDSDPEFLKEYLWVIARLLPDNEPLVSFDIDLREARSADIAKQFFEDRGYVVWIVSR